MLQSKGKDEEALETFQAGLEAVEDIESRKGLQRAMMDVIKKMSIDEVEVSPASSNLYYTARAL